MTTETTATVIDGGLELDQRLDLPNQSRVRVAIEPVRELARRVHFWPRVVEEVLRATSGPLGRSPVYTRRTA